MPVNIENNNLKYLTALSCFSKFGPRRLEKIKKYFPDMETAFKASAKELMAAGIKENIANEFAVARNDINTEKIMEQLAKEDIKTMDINNSLYPNLLKEIYDPPQLLYYKGELMENEKFGLAVVGARKHTDYGKMAVEKITAGLARNNLTIVSGLALGIDAIAHSTALTENGRTIAVLGSGLDRANIYPSTNRYLADKIIDSGGAIISEFPIGTPPLRHHFPQRNRIIAGISLGTLVIEAGEQSGALITARFALEQNREVFAVPGSIFSAASAGPNKLIKQGCAPITDADDIIEALDLSLATDYVDNKKISPETPEEEKIFSHLAPEPTHIDELIRLTKLDTNKINSTLTMMEIKGIVRNIGNMRYIITK